MEIGHCHIVIQGISSRENILPLHMKKFLLNYMGLYSLGMLINRVCCDLLLNEDSLDAFVDEILEWELGKLGRLVSYEISQAKMDIIKADAERTMVTLKQFYLPYLYQYIHPDNCAIESFTEMERDYRFCLIRVNLRSVPHEPRDIPLTLCYGLGLFTNGRVS